MQVNKKHHPVLQLDHTSHPQSYLVAEAVAAKMKTKVRIMTNVQKSVIISARATSLQIGAAGPRFAPTKKN